MHTLDRKNASVRSALDAAEHVEPQSGALDQGQRLLGQAGMRLVKEEEEARPLEDISDQRSQTTTTREVMP